MGGYRCGVEKTKGKAKEVVGWATGDRRVEAEGRVEQKVADSPADVTEKAVDEETDAVREEHGEFDPDRHR